MCMWIFFLKYTLFGWLFCCFVKIIFKPSFFNVFHTIHLYNLFVIFSTNICPIVRNPFEVTPPITQPIFCFMQPHRLQSMLRNHAMQYTYVTQPMLHNLYYATYAYVTQPHYILYAIIQPRLRNHASNLNLRHHITCVTEPQHNLAMYSTNLCYATYITQLHNLFEHNARPTAT